MNTTTFHNQSGFSLVETLVAITILLIVIVGPMTIATNASRSTGFANDQTIAYFLAQEGLELVQMARDEELLSEFNAPSGPAGTPYGWNRFLGSTGVLNDCVESGAAEQCGITMNVTTGTLDVVDCSAAPAACRLYYDATPGQRDRYTHTVTATSTPYTRTIRIESPAGGDPTGDNEAKVTSTVRWRTGDQLEEQSVTATTYLFNIYDR